MLQTKKILIASWNHDKFREYRALLKKLTGTAVVPMLSDTVLANPEKLALAAAPSLNAIERAKTIARFANQSAHAPVLADACELIVSIDSKELLIADDDSTISCANLPQGCELDHLARRLGGVRERPARYACAIALHLEGVMLTAVKTVSGNVVAEPRGSEGCGFDPVFIPDDGAHTLGQMPVDQRSLYSPRAIALRDLWDQVTRAHLELVRQVP